MSDLCWLVIQNNWNSLHT